MPRRARSSGAPGGVSAPAASAAAAAAATEAPSGHARIVHTQAQASALNLRPNSLQYASLAMAGLLRDEGTSPFAAARPVRSARQHSPLTASSMAVAMRAIHNLDGSVASTREHAAMVLYTAHPSDPSPEDGMPLAEALLYFQMDGGAVALEDLMQAVFDALGLPHFARCSVRIDFWYSTREVGVPSTFSDIPLGRTGNSVRQVPRYFQGNKFTAGSEQQLLEKVNEALQRFLQKLDQLPDADGSNRALDRLICAQVWATPNADPSNYVGVQKSGYIDFGEAECVDGVPVMPSSIFHSRGIITLNPDVPVGDTRCVARALMTALDPVIMARSTISLVNIYEAAVQGAEAKVRHEQRRLPEKKVGRSVYERRLAAVRDAEKELARLVDLKEQAVRTTHATGGYVPGAKDDGRARKRYATIERELAAAFAGKHKVVDFSRAPQFRSAVLMDRPTVEALRSCIRPGHKVAIQVWGVNTGNKLGLNYRDPRANLEWVKAGGVVANLVVAAQHASVLCSLQAACNHAVGQAANRVYCGFCGSFKSRGGVAESLAIYQHQVSGCPTGVDAQLTKSLCPSNRRQVDRRDYRALNRSLTLASFSASWPLSSKEPQQVSLRVWTRGVEDWNESMELSFTGSVAVGNPVLQLLTTLATKSEIEWLRGRLHAYRPPNPTELEELQHSDPADYVCFGCRLPMDGPSVWQIQNAQCTSKTPRVHEGSEDSFAGSDSLVDAGTEAGDGMGDADEDEDADLDLDRADDAASVGSSASDKEENPSKPVKHHCHATGHVWWAHADCNSFMAQSTDRLVLEVTDSRSMGALMGIVFSKSFIELYLQNKPPTLQKRDGVTRRLCLRLAGSPRKPYPSEIKRRRDAGLDPDAQNTLIPTSVVLDFRLATCMQPNWQAEVEADYSLDCAAESKRCLTLLKNWAEREFLRTGLWAPTFSTVVGFGRACLYRMSIQALGPGVTPTSIVSSEVLEHARKLTAGGMMILGQYVEHELETPLDRSECILNFDVTSAYPHLLGASLPLFEHATECVYDFSSNVEAGIKWLREDADVTLEGKSIETLEIWGEFPPELHASLAAVPPVFSRMLVSPKHLSRFQRLHMGLDINAKPREASVGHFFPLTGAVVFSRTAYFYMRLGFRFSKIGKVFSIPSAPWGRPFAEDLERRRREAHERKDAAVVADLKQVGVTVVGSLAIDPRRFLRYKVVKAWHDGPEHHMSAVDKVESDPRSMNKFFSVGECKVYEMAPRRITHTALTFVNSYIVEMQRLRLLELWYGRQPGMGYADAPGFRDWGAPGDVTVVYGNTDSLILRIKSSSVGPTHGLFADVRQEILATHWRQLDLSNVLDTSPFLKACADNPSLKEELAHTRTTNAGRFGCLKEESGWVGYEAAVINGPGRYALRVIQSPGETLLKHTGTYEKDQLKAIPKEWHSLDKPPTFEEFAASWLNRPLPVAPPLAARLASAPGTLDEQVEVTPVRHHVSIWGNKSAIVQGDAPYHVWPLGAQIPEAQACVAGTAW